MQYLDMINGLQGDDPEQTQKIYKAAIRQGAALYFLWETAVDSKHKIVSTVCFKLHMLLAKHWGYDK